MRTLPFAAVLVLLAAASAAADPGGIHSVNSVPYEIAVLGDVEGMQHRLDSFIDGSGAFTRNADGTVDLKDGKAVVFMGDATGRGAEDHKILEFMLQMKSRYPTRFTALMGNRDVWYMAWASEMSDEGMNAQNPKFDAWLTEQGLDPAAHRGDRLTKMRYLFDKKLGPDAAELRHEELVREGKSGTEQEILDSFMEDVRPGGLAARYLRVAQMAFVDESTRTLFVHGAAKKQSLGYVPGRSGRIRDVREWVQTLNEKAHQYVEEGIFSSSAPGHVDELIDYVNDREHSVVNGRFDDSRGSPLVSDAETRETLMEQGLFRIAVGHTPHGEFPVIGRVGRFQILMTDASYNSSGVTPRIILNADHVSSLVEVPTRPGAPTLKVEIDLTYGQDSLQGLHITDGGMIVGKLGQDYVTYRIGPGFKRNYEVADEQTLRPQLLTSFGAATGACRGAFSPLAAPGGP